MHLKTFTLEVTRVENIRKGEGLGGLESKISCQKYNGEGMIKNRNRRQF